MLVDEFASGASSATRAAELYKHFVWGLQVQRTASSALAWMQKRGMEPHPEDRVAKMAKIGARGRWPANCERDMHKLLMRSGQQLGAKMEWVKARLFNPSLLVETDEWVPVLFPDAVLTALWEKGEDVFRHVVLGGMSEEDVAAYWRHVSSLPWFRDNPGRQWHCPGRMAAFGTYGDEVQCYRNSECGIVSITGWQLELAVAAEPLLRLFPFAVLSEYHETPFTYNDLMAHLVPRLQRLCDPSEVWPWSHRGFYFCFTGCFGDLKWLSDKMEVHNFKKNEFCSRCHCTKKGPDREQTLPNMSADPSVHAPRAYTQEELVAFSPLFEMSGMNMARVMHDVAHSQYLGTGKVCNGDSEDFVGVFRAINALFVQLPLVCR